MTATPWGFRDILPEEAQAREEIACTVKGCFREHHYLPVETPLLEDKGSLEEGGRITDTPFKLFDDDGRLLVVRPDNTLPIVRLVSTRMRAADLPLRLRYEAPVVRECQRNAGGSRQFTQLGFELIGAGDAAGDVEIVSLVAEAVRELALPDARIIAGSVRPFKELLAVCEDRELAAEALRCVHANDFVGLDARVAASVESDAVKAAISELPRLHGGAEVLDRVDALLEAAGIVAPLLPVLGLDSPALSCLTVIAIGAGAMTVSHANDSYFWVVTNFGEMTPQDGYKTQTLGTLVIGVVSIIGVFIVSLFLH